MCALSRRDRIRHPRSRPARILLLYCACVIFLLFSSPLPAQPIGPDIRLFDLFSHGLLHDSIRIGGAAVVDSSIIAVWGNRRVLDDGEAVPALAVAGDGVTPRLLTDDRARPHDGLAVISLGPTALVLWTDVRSGGEGIYAAFLDRRGERVRPDTLLVPGAEMRQKPISFAGDGRTLVLLSRIRDGVHVIEETYLDPGGVLLSGPEVIRHGKFPPDGYRPMSLYNGGLHVSVVGDSPIVILKNGDVYPHEIPVDRFDRPFVTDGPVSIVTTLPGHRLVRYDSLHHQQPAWSVDDVRGAAIGHDSVGWYTAGFNGKYGYHSISSTYCYYFYIERHYADTASGARLAIGYDTILGPCAPVSSMLIGVVESKTDVRQIADGQTRLSGTWTVAFDRHGPPTYEESTHGGYKDYYTRQNRAIPQVSTTVVDVWVNQDSSGVLVNVISQGLIRTVRYGIVTPVARDPGSTYSPVLSSRDGTLYVGGTSETANLFAAKLPRGDTSRAVLFPLVDPSSEVLSGQYHRGWNLTGFLVQQRTVRDEPSILEEQKTTTIDHFWWRIDSTGWRRQAIQQLRKSYSSTEGAAYYPSVAYDPNLDEWLWFSSFTVGYPDPTAYDLRPASTLDFMNVRTGVDRHTGSATHTMPAGVILPLDSSHIFHIGEDRRFRLYGPRMIWNEDGTTDPVLEPGIARRFDTIGVQRLYGDRFLVSGIDREKRELVLISRNLDGQVLGTRNFEVDSASAQLPMIMQHGRDSVVLILINTPEGPVLSMMGPQGQIVVDDDGKEIGEVHLSRGAYPTRDVIGAVAGDTLWVAWTDQRSGMPQVYLNGVHLSKSRVWERQPDPPVVWQPPLDTTVVGNLVNELTPQQRIERYGFAIYSVTPNPAWRRASVVIGSDVRRGIRLDQYDALGRRIGSALIDALPGVHEYPLPEVYVDGGLFFVRLSGSGHQETTSHFIYPE